jgi:hypothetical protein
VAVVHALRERMMLIWMVFAKKLRIAARVELVVSDGLMILAIPVVQIIRII